MVKAMSDGGFEDLGWFGHTLQLVIHDGIFSQRAIKDALAICQNIVGHFKSFEDHSRQSTITQA